MLVVSENLSGIVRTMTICDPQLIEEYSLCIALDPQVRRMRKEPRQNVIYGVDYDEDAIFQPLECVDRDLVLAPGDRVLGCSAHRYDMPTGYFGLVQTKGSLARLFVSATCNDGQVEPGYGGKITLEIANDSTFEVTLPVGSTIAQLFVFRCSTHARPYAGRYQGATGPTLAAFGQRALERS